MRRAFILGGSALYLGIGALTHWAMLGPTFVPGSVASWGTLLGWPVVIFALAMLAGLLVVIAVGVGMLIFEWFDDRKRARLRRRK